MRILCLLFMLTLAGPVQAEIIQYNNTPIVDLEFNGVRLGQYPGEEMICIQGGCPAGEIGVGRYQGRALIDIYRLPKEITHFAMAEITAPGYYFYQNYLYQVAFNIGCRPETAEACSEAIITELDEQYGLTLVDEKIKPGAHELTRVQMTYLTDAGAVVEAGWEQRRLSRFNNWVKIYDKTLMDALRLAANPDYRVVDRSK